METQMLALNNNWLDGSGIGATNSNYTPTQATGLLTGTVNGTYYCWPNTYYPSSYTYPLYVSSPARPIKLALSEIERLRKAARADKALKAILAKFTDQIEITVDFE